MAIRVDKKMMKLSLVVLFLASMAALTVAASVIPPQPENLTLVMASVD